MDLLLPILVAVCPRPRGPVPERKEALQNHSYYLLTKLLNKEETCVVTSIVGHIERGEGRVGIQQIAAENYVSTTFIMKLCKRLGFDGYSELFYHLSMQIGGYSNETHTESLQSIIDEYSQENVARFCALLSEYRNQKMFAIGTGFSDIVADYMVQRLAICGFMVFNSVHFL